MGYDLSSLNAPKEDSYFRFNIAGWTQLLNMALDYGWKPEGTVMDEGFFMSACGMGEEQAKREVDNWDGSYTSNDWQQVTDSDANNLKEALGKIMEDKKFLSKIDPYWTDKIPQFIKFLDHGGFVIG